MDTPWSLTAEQRADTVARIRANMASMAFFAKTPLNDAELSAEAAKLEAKAYAVAGVQGTVTNCHRPHAETLQASAARCLVFGRGMKRLETAHFPPSDETRRPTSAS